MINRLIMGLAVASAILYSIGDIHIEGSMGTLDVKYSERSLVPLVRVTVGNMEYVLLR